MSEISQLLDDMIKMIDGMLLETGNREIVSASQMGDMLLDLRLTVNHTQQLLDIETISCSKE